MYRTKGTYSCTVQKRDGNGVVNECIEETE